MKVKLILPRNSHTDSLYGTGTWQRDETKDVDELTAKKLLRHADVWEASEDKATESIIVPPPEKPDNSKMQETYDLINAMQEKEQVKTFIKTQFNLPVDMRNYKTLDGIKRYAIQLSDQFGVLQ